MTPVQQTPVVDSHVHVWLDDRERFPRGDTPYPASPELLLEHMTTAGERFPA